MRLKKISALTMWLPGLEPVSQANIADQKPATILQFPVPAHAPAPSLNTCWAPLDESAFDSLTGPVSKFEANLSAIALLKTLETENRQPTDSERHILNRFTGWGGLPQAFNTNQTDPAWLERSETLKTLLSPTEWNSAFEATPNSHFTSLEVINAIWQALKKIGFAGGRIIEPSAGTGYFLGGMPADIIERSDVTAIELDSITSRILSKLYGSKANVLNSALEKTALPDNYFDLAVSNVPFGNYTLSEFRNVPYAKFLIHDYFFGRALDLVRPGGLVAFVTSSGTMDKIGREVRAYLGSVADLVSSVRLPNTAFKHLAGTEVTTDILILKKREIGQSNTAPNWLNVRMLPTSSPIHGEPHTHRSYAFQINDFYINHPENVLGKIKLTGNAYRETPACTPDGEMVEGLYSWVQRLPSSIYREVKTESAVPAHPEGANLDEGFQWIDGSLYCTIGRDTQKVDFPTKKMARVVGMMQIRDAAKALIQAQPLTSDDAILETYRLALNASYDNFVSTNGFINERVNRQAFSTDPTLPLLLSLEIWDSKNNSASKAPIFTQRTVGVIHRIEQADTPIEAMLVSLVELGRIDPSRMSELLGTPAIPALESLEAEGQVFLDPETGNWVTSDVYLSGHIRQKMAIAKTAGARFENNYRALEAVLPTDLTPNEIGARIGSTWIPLSDYESFLDHLLQGKGASVDFSAVAGAWSVTAAHNICSGILGTQTYGTNRVNAVDLFALALNQQLPCVTDPAPNDRTKRVINQAATIAAREKQSEIREKFTEWLWSDPARAERLVRLYNDQFNSHVQQQFDGSRLTLPGFSNCVTLHKHQLDAIWRIVTSGLNTLLAHVVGAGKTLTSICAGMELRRLGKASKILYVVPNNMLEQFTNEFLRAYPSAKVLMATKEDLTGNKRQNFLSRIATGLWDAVLCTHATFERIKMGDDYVRDYIQIEIDRITAAISGASQDRGNRIVKELARAKKQWTTKLEKLSADHKKDSLLSFEDLGIDYIFADEAHMWKNLYRHTKMSRVAGLPNSNSERSFDMLLKTRHIMSKRDHKSGVVFMTGTPLSNSMAELHVMQRFLQPRALGAACLDNFDTWAGNFGESVTALELAPDGSGYRMQTRFSKFINIPELMGLFRQVADIRTAEMIALPVPFAVKETIATEPSEELKTFVRSLVERADSIRAGSVHPSVDNMLAVTNDGRKAALDMRLVGGTEAGSEGKIGVCAAQVFKIWDETRDTKATQIVFCDLSTPKSDGSFNAYQEMRDLLCSFGVPENEIAFIHDHDSDFAKEALYSAVRKGTVRVLLGSTSKLGVGTNVQDKLIALHHLDAPWRPSDMEQREGRIIRQGNSHATVRIFRYVTKQSFDAYIFQTLENKSRFISQVMSGDETIRSAEDLELAALSYAEIKAIASGNPLVMEKAAIDSEVVKLATVKNEWAKQQWANKQELSHIPSRLQYLSNRIVNLGKDALQYQPGSRIIIQGYTYKDAAETGRALKKALRGIAPGNTRTIGTVGHFQITAQPSLTGFYGFSLVGHAEIELGRFDSGVAVIEAIEKQVANLNSIKESASLALERLEQRNAALQAEVHKPFDKQDRLDALIKRQVEIEMALDLNKGENTVLEESPEEA